MTDQKPRTKDPSYHVFERTAAGAYDLLTVGAPVKAPNRTAAIKQAVSDVRPIAQTKERVFVVVPLKEFQMFQHRVETTTVDLWEPLPEPPAALGVDTGGNASARPSTPDA